MRVPRERQLSGGCSASDGLLWLGAVPTTRSSLTKPGFWLWHTVLCAGQG